MRKIPAAKAGNMAIPFQSDVSSQLVAAKDAARDCPPMQAVYRGKAGCEESRVELKERCYV